jgi:hypothetical protein
MQNAELPLKRNDEQSLKFIVKIFWSSKIESKALSSLFYLLFAKIITVFCTAEDFATVSVNVTVLSLKLHVYKVSIIFA